MSSIGETDEFSFPAIPRGRGESPFTLRQLLFKGGAATVKNEIESVIQSGLLGSELQSRRTLVCAIHAYISGLLTKGGSPETARRQITIITGFFCWADISEIVNLTTELLLQVYLQYGEYLWHRCNIEKSIQPETAYNYARVTGQIFDAVLERPTPMVTLTRLRRQIGMGAPLGDAADKQNLERTFEFGHLLHDICSEVTISLIRGPRDAHIKLRDGQTIVLRVGKQPGNGKRDGYNIRASAEALNRFNLDRTLNSFVRMTRANLRIQAELLIFIGQTGMNLGVAQLLNIRRFSYSSDIEGYKVREYKPRRQGEVLFEIFSEYRNHFEHYLEWRKKLFPDSEALFPLMRIRGTRETKSPSFSSIRRICQDAGIEWFSPSALRNTRVNWLLRQTGDVSATAEMAQHSEDVLLRNYEKPSFQVAAREITSFHRLTDPSLMAEDLAPSVAPGLCRSRPEASDDNPHILLKPDCQHASGCLGCRDHRPIDSFDYVWSLICFKHLKSIEHSKMRNGLQQSERPEPSKKVIDKLMLQLDEFRESSEVRSEWVNEAEIRISEGHYHSQWAYLIEPLEGKFA